MDQEPFERDRDAETGENPPATGSEGQKSGDSAPKVPDGRSKGNKVQVLRSDSQVTPPHDPRAAIAEALSGILTNTQVTFLLQEVLAVTKTIPVSVTCSNCGHL